MNSHTTQTRCSRCLYDDTVPNITFDAEGVCNYCHQHDAMDAEYPVGTDGERRLQALVEKIKHEGRNKRYDVVVGVSGGCDSSYMLYKAKSLGLRPLAVHFDNTWNSTVAVENIQNVLKALDVDLYTYVVDNEEYDDIYRSFLKAGVRDVEAPTDIGLAVTLNMACDKYKVKYIFEGHSFRSEGICPLGWLYMDGKYIQSVQKRFGTHKLRTFPNLWMSSFIRWTAFSSIKKIRPLYFLNYQKQAAMALLSKELGWKWYGGHHLENRFTAFYWSYFMYRRFGIDGRLLGHSALVRSGQMSRDEGLKTLSDPPVYDPDIVNMVKKRLGFSDAEFEEIMRLPERTYRDFKTYKQTFERLRWFFWLLYKADRVPKSFYMKYTVPDLRPLQQKVSLPADITPGTSPINREAVSRT
jgi:N-acetyl sugar amidotransferase